MKRPRSPAINCDDVEVTPEEQILIDAIGQGRVLAVMRGDSQLNRLVDRLGSVMIHIGRLLSAFRKSAHHNITGKQSVTEQLGISHNAVYLRLRYFGLSADDFRDPSVTVYALLLRSKYASLVKQVLDVTRTRG